jgi:hypothetical protein
LGYQAGGREPDALAAFAAKPWKKGFHYLHGLLVLREIQRIHSLHNAHQL